MSSNSSNLHSRNLDKCKKHHILPNSAILTWFYKTKAPKSLHRKCSLVIFLDKLKDEDFLPLIDLFSSSTTSFEIDVVDILHDSPCIVNEEDVMSLMRAVGMKLRAVDLRGVSLSKDFLRDLFNCGLPCEVLSLASPNIRNLNMEGSFIKLHTLNLDFCTSLTSLQKDFFPCMPFLTRLSMCETRVSNLWMTSAALTKLPLVELRFQNCLCCEDTRPCPASLYKELNLLISNQNGLRQSTTYDDSLYDIEVNFSSQNEVSINKLSISDEDEFLVNEFESKKNVSSHHPSPICFEKHYREYLVTSLPRLEVLDNLPIRKVDREMAKTVFSKHYEYLPNKRQRTESLFDILKNREIGSKKQSNLKNCNSQHYFSRSLSAAKVGCSTWPLIQPVSDFNYFEAEEGKRLRPRQFEYHPSIPRLMGIGTLDGEIVVINHENGKVVGYVPSNGAMSSVLGLCWLKKYPSKILAGSDNGSLKLYDINQMLPIAKDIYCSIKNSAIYDDFKQLTSVHVNSTDDQFLASGYSKSVALYDINSGKRLHLFENIHQEPINVAKFSHHSPFMFATSSFDHDIKMWDLRQKPLQPCYTVSSSRGNVMVCFSHDDLYLLVSAVDNEVKQLLAVDGRVHMKFDIASTGSAHNYTRSYYMNGRDYIITGSCDEHVVRICCAQTGRRLRDVCLEDKSSRSSMFVQSLRGDPFREFHMSILAAYKHPKSKWEIMKVNMLSSNHSSEDNSYFQQS